MKTNSNQPINLLNRVRSKLKRFVGAIVPPDEVEDIVQDTYVKIWQQHNKQQDEVNQSYVFTVAKNLAIDYLRKPNVKHHQAVEDEAEFGASNADANFNQLEADRKFVSFCQAVQQLPPQCRKVFVMKKVYGMKIKEIAEELNLSPRTVEVQLQRGYVKFQYLVEQANGHK
ncbi:RNA polymerase sigma factor [Catenovulum sp. SX2]|uniref:RNA polymerase sigma factor n=1 Tax=Catenovulum sp. SX2 TaxID=3398614 RepID=UPI003F8744BE